jgi:hypothetical protein
MRRRSEFRQLRSDGRWFYIPRRQEHMPHLHEQWAVAEPLSGYPTHILDNRPRSLADPTPMSFMGRILRASCQSTAGYVSLSKSVFLGEAASVRCQALTLRSAPLRDNSCSAFRARESKYFQGW